ERMGGVWGFGNKSVGHRPAGKAGGNAPHSGRPQADRLFALALALADWQIRGHVVMGVGGRELPVVLDEAVVVLQNARGADVLTGVAHPGTRAVPDQVVVVAVVAPGAPPLAIA